MTAIDAVLTDRQQASYWRDGYLYPIRVMSSGEAADLRAEFEAFEHRWADDPGLPAPFKDYCRANLHVVSTTAARVAHDPAVLDAVSSILGHDLLCWMVELIAKEPNTDKILSMHQDLTYWGLHGADKVVTAWLALTEVRLANGAMRFVTGSHRAGQAAHRDTYAENNVLSRGQEVAVDYDLADEVVVELDPGEISLHHGHMFHGSGRNSTDHRRLAIVIRYVTPDVAQVVANRDYGMLVRGVNRQSNGDLGNMINIAPPTADFSPTAIALHTEITEAQMAPLSAGADPDRYGYQRT